MNFEEFLALPEAIRKTIDADPAGHLALRELRKHGVNVDAILALLPAYVEEARAPKSRYKQSGHFEAGTFGTDGHFRRITISPSRLKSLAGRLEEMADDVLLAGFLIPLPEKLAKTYVAMRTLAEWIKKNPPRIPDSRLLRGKTRQLRLIVSHAIPPNCKLESWELANHLARVIEPVAKQFEFHPPTQESLQKLMERSLFHSE